MTTEGLLEWQDTVNDLNLPFFEAADAIFINYTWKEDTPAQAADAAELGRALRHLQLLQALLTDHHGLLDTRLVQVGCSQCRGQPECHTPVAEVWSAETWHLP